MTLKYRVCNTVINAGFPFSKNRDIDRAIGDITSDDDYKKVSDMQQRIMDVIESHICNRLILKVNSIKGFK